MRRVLDSSRDVGLKFNPKEMKLRVPELSYVGHEFSSEGLKPGLVWVPQKLKRYLN